MIEIKNIRKQFGDVQAIHDMSADIREGQFLDWSERTVPGKVHF